MPSRNQKVRRLGIRRSSRLFSLKLQSNKLVIAKVGLALAGSLMLGALPVFADNPGMENRKDAWQNFMNSNPGMQGKELRQLFNVQWKNERNDTPRSIAQPIFQNVSITQDHHSNDAGSAAMTLHEAREAQRALRLEQRENQNLLKQTLREERQAQNALQQINAQKFVNLNGRISLDLGSAIENITLGDKLFQNESSLTITVGGQTKIVSAGSKVTAAEYVAAKQVLAAGGQKLDIDSSGRAVGGEVDLSALTSGNQTLKVKDLAIPVAVTAAGDFGKGGDVKITGDLLNSGSIVAYSSEKKVQGASIFADNITNSQTGSITSQLNNVAKSNGGVVGDLSLSLHADDSLTNYGSISSTGDLTLTANKSVQNLGASASISAARSLNVTTPTITNQGLVSSQSSSINISAPIDADLTINGAGGVIQALTGDINIGSPERTDKFDTTIHGGDLLSGNLNIHSGNGHIEVIADSISGYLNVKGGSGRVSALEGDLTIRSAEFTGDPMFTAANDLNIAFLNLTLPGQPITLIAGRDINNFTVPPDLPPDVIPPDEDQPITTISTAGGSGIGHITIIAGAVLSDGFPSGKIVTGPSATGGNINLGNITTISAGIADTNPAPDITIIAFGGTDRGNIDLHNATITTGSNTPNSEGGSVTIIGGGTSINVGNIVATVPRIGSVLFNPGRVLVANSNPVGSISFANDGTPSPLTAPGRCFEPGSRIANAQLNIGSITAGGTQQITVLGGSSVDIGSVTSPTTGIKADAIGTLTVGSMDVGGANFTAGSINFNGVINTGLITAIARGDISAGAGAQINANLGISGPLVILVAGAEYTQGANWFDNQVTGVSATGGNIDLSNLTSFTTQKSGPGDANGGKISLVAYRGSGGGFISTPLSTGMYTSGSGNGNNGGVYISAGADSSNAIKINNAIDTGSTAGAVGSGKIILSAVQAKTGYSLSHLSAAVDFDFITGLARGAGGIEIDGGITTRAANINLYAGTGGINISDVSGGYLSASTTGNLNFNGNLNITRTYGVADGSIGLNKAHGFLTSPGGVLLISGGDISSQGSIITSNLSGNGGNATLIAGATYQENLAATPAYKVTSVSVTGISATGGNVNLSGMDEFTATGINGSAGDGGAVTFIAYRGSGGGGGQVITQSNINQRILSVGNGSGSNGDVLIAAGANIPNAIQITCGIVTGHTDFTGFAGTAGTGSITLSAIQPNTGYALNTAGDFKVDPNSVLGTAPESGGILLKSNLLTYNSTITLTAGGAVSCGDGYARLTGSDFKITAAAIGAASFEERLYLSSYNAPASLEVHSGSGDAFLSWSSPYALTLAGGSSAKTFSLFSSSEIVTAGDITFTGDVELKAERFTNSHAFATTGGDIRIEGGELTIDGGSGGSISASGEILVTALSDLTLMGHTTYLSTVKLQTSQLGGTIHIANGSQSTATVTSYLNSENLSFEGGSLVTFTEPYGQNGDSWIYLNAPGGTYAAFDNAGLGDVHISGNLTLSNVNLAIIAGHRISFGQGIIDLSSANGGGSLTLLAGYTALPVVGSVVVHDKTTTFTNFAPGPQKGSIDAASSTIITSGGSGAAGNVLAIANGDITLGDIIASSTGSTGGSVRLIANGNLRVGDINTTGANAGDSGAVVLANAVANVPGSFTVSNGTAANADQVSVGALSAGNMSFSSINAGAASISVSGAQRAGLDSILGNGSSIIASTLNLNTGAGNATIRYSSFSEINVNSTGAGTISLYNTGNATLNSTASGASTLTIDNTGDLTLGAITGNYQEIDVVTSAELVHNSGSINSNSVKLKASTFDLVGGAIGQAGSTISIESTGAFSGGTLGTVVGGLVTLTQSGSMTDSTILNGISANSLVLRANGAGANIGTSTSSRFLLPTNLTVINVAAGGSVFLASALASSDTLTLSGHAGGAAFDVLSASNINLGDVTALDGNIKFDGNVVSIANTIKTVTGDISIHASQLNNTGTISAFANKVTIDAAAVSNSNSIVSHGGDITITTEVLTNTGSISSASTSAAIGDINISSHAGNGLTLVGGSSSAGTLAASGEINVVAAASNLVLDSKTTFLTAASLIAAGTGQSVITNAGSTTTATISSRIITSSLQNNGNLTVFTPPDGGQPGNTWTVGNLHSLTYSDTSNLVLTGAFNISGGNLAFISAGNVDLSGATIDLSGSQGGNLTIMSGWNYSPALSANSDPTTTFHSFTASGGGDISVGAINLQGTSGSGGTLIALANGQATFDSINLSGTTSGGRMLVFAKDDITIGDITGNGGSSTGATIDLRTADPVVGSGNAFAIRGGTIINGTNTISSSVTRPANITVGNIDIGDGNLSGRAGGSLNFTGDVTAHNIALSANTLDFTALTTLSSSVDQGGNAGYLSLTVGSISTSNNNHLILSAAGQSGHGGEIRVNWKGGAISLGSGANDVFEFRTGSDSGNGGISRIDSLANITINAGAFTGTSTTTASQVHVDTTSDISISSNDAFNVSTTSGKGAVIELNAGSDGSGTLSFGGNTGFFWQANGVGTSGDGGALIFTGSDITTVGNSAVNPLELTAAGSGTGNGGTIIWRSNSAIPVFFGPPAKAPKGASLFLTADATGGGAGGTIDIRVGGNLTVNDTARLDASSDGTAVGALAGARYTLRAGQVGTGALIINGSLDASGMAGGNGGLLDLESRSSAGFSVGATKLPKNGVAGSLTADGPGGVVAITNLGGGISVLTNSALVADEMRFAIGGTGAFVAKNVTINATERLSFLGASGSIGDSKPLQVNTADLSVNTAGLVNIQNSFAGASELRDSTGGKGFTLITAGDTIVNNISTTQGSITIREATGTLSVANGATLTANNGAMTLQNLDVAAGIIDIGAGATVETQGKGKNTTLVIGATVPKKGINPVPPLDAPNGVTSINIVGKGVVFFGVPGSVVANDSTVNAINKSVIFQGSTAGSIRLGTGSTITADPPSPVSNPSINLDSAPQLHTVSNISLVTAAESDYVVSFDRSAVLYSSPANGVLDASIRLSNSEDNSYMVGLMKNPGEADAAVCCDAPLLLEAICADNKLHTIEHSNRLLVKEGNVLFVPHKDTYVETPNGNIHIDANSIVLISTTTAGLAVYDLEDQHKGSVIVEANGHNVILSPGRHIMITKHHTAEFGQVNAIETIAHRNVQSAVKNGHRAHTSEFSVITAIDTVKPLKAMILSKHPQAKHIADRMLKTTAIILQLGGNSNEQYQHYCRPRMTAMQK